MGNVSLKVLEKSLNFLFKNGYEPCIYEQDLYSRSRTVHKVPVILLPPRPASCLLPPASPTHKNPESHGMCPKGSI